MALQAAFIFLSAQGDPAIHHNVTDAGDVKLSTYAVKDYAAACKLSEQLASQGFVAIELCGGFGTQGVAAIDRAVNGKAVVGVVRFDHHPGLGHSSGDALFSSR